MVGAEQPASFGALLRQHRLAAGLTQEALAERAGLSVRAVQHLERALGQPQRQTARRLADALALTAEPRTQFERAAAPAPRRRAPSRGVAPRDHPPGARRAVPGCDDVDPDPNLGERPVWELSRSLIPFTLTSLIGRERELADLQALLQTRRLLTLTGPGGAGKTRLALEVTDRVRRAYPDGIYIVSLAPLTDPGLVASTMAEAFGMYKTIGRPLSDSLARFIGENTVLVLLDNFEHLLSARPLLADLLSACPKLTMLVTSREVLRLRGEQVYPVPPLTLPRGNVLSVKRDPVSVVSESEAVRLFVDRAQSSQPAFRLDASNASAVADICCRLDGLPLAIELAAVRVRLLTPEALRMRLVHRLQLLTGGAHDLPARQRTLRDAIGWSYDLLSEAERTLFRRLSVFEGGYTLEAAEAVCREDGDLDGSVIDGVASLIAQSLVQQQEGVDCEPRYSMLESIREYAREQLEASGEGPVVQDHHGDWFLAFVEAAEPELRGPRQVAWLERLARDHGNVRAALRYAAEAHHVESGLRMAGALWRFWQIRGHLREGRAWLDRLLALPEASARTAGRARALNAAGFLAFLLGDYPTARALHEESLAIRRDLGEPLGVVESLHNLGLTVRCQAEHAAAQTLFLEGLTISRTIADHFWEARLLLGLARTYFYQGEHAASGALLEESLRISTEVGDLVGQAIALGDLSDIAHATGDAGRARALIAESFVLWRGLHDERGMAQCAEGLALQIGVLDHLDPAVRLLSSASALRVEIGEPPSPSRQQQLDRMLARARSILGDAAYTAARTDGAARPAADVIDYWFARLESHDGLANPASASGASSSTGR
jgi:predicted ATPase/DNA-binding XRE family transcriptional regulator